MAENAKSIVENTNIPELRDVLTGVAAQAMRGVIPNGWRLDGAAFNRDWEPSEYADDDDSEYDTGDDYTLTAAGPVPANDPRRNREVVTLRLSSTGKMPSGDPLRFTARVKDDGKIKVVSISTDDENGKYIY